MKLWKVFVTVYSAARPFDMCPRRASVHRGSFQLGISPVERPRASFQATQQNVRTCSELVTALLAPNYGAKKR